MDKIGLLDTVERYLDDKMTPEERIAFERLRRTDPEVDQLVVEQSVLLQKLQQFADDRHLRTSLREIHRSLAGKGIIKPAQPRALLIQLWKKHRRVMAVAATIAGITTLLIAGMATYYSRK